MFCIGNKEYVDWLEEDGGSLDLFGCQPGAIAPAEVVTRIFPRRNNFLFFEVTNRSFHQVSEVLTSCKPRLSISGWFHGMPLKRPPLAIEPPVTLVTPSSKPVSVLSLSPEYQREKSWAGVGEVFLEESMVMLQHFFEAADASALLKELSALSSAAWAHAGPANKRNYSHLKTDSELALPVRVRAAFEYFTSAVFVELLKKLTNLELVSCHCELRKFTSGCYTLAHDADADKAHDRLVVSFWLHDGAWSNAVDSEGSEVEVGGDLIFLAEDEDEDLAIFPPISNCLSVVYCDQGCLSFVRYVNHYANNNAAYQFSLQFREGVASNTESSSSSRLQI